MINNPTLKYYAFDATPKVEEQQYMEFPDRDELYERKNDLNDYKKDPHISKVIELYQPFFEKGINYMSDGKYINSYLEGSILYYFNEAFSLCTKLSIDPTPEEYFINEYYQDISGNKIERYFILSMVYVLLAINGFVRKQHLKMIDILYQFLCSRCPIDIMCKELLFISEFYQSQELPFWLFKPQIDQYEYTKLKVDEGLPEDEKEQEAAIIEMRKKVSEHAKLFNEMLKSYQSQSGPSVKDKEKYKRAPLKVRLNALLGIMKDANIGMDTKDWTKVARMAAFILDSTYDYVHNLKDDGFDLTEKAHGKYVNEVNRYFADLDSTIQLKCKKDLNPSK